MQSSGPLKIIAITLPEFIPGEAEHIKDILDTNTAEYVHIRKPGSRQEETARLLTEIPERLHERLKLHDHFELANKLNIGGVHLNSRNPDAPEGIKKISKSVHTLEELKDIDNYEYVTLSPIYNSISKPGYLAAFDMEELKNLIKGKRVVALGGIVPEKFPELIRHGFYGAAMLSYFWKLSKNIN